MGSLTRTSNFQNKSKYTNKIPEYAREFKKEWLFISGINKMCEKIIERIDNINNVYEEEEVFYTPLAKNLMNYFSRFFRYQKLDYANKISELYFKEREI